MHRAIKGGITLAGLAAITAGSAVGLASRGAASDADGPPIQHLVVIFQENVSFDHYFATYPDATNPSGEPGFTAAANTPRVNNLQSAALLTNNPNESNPQRLDRSQPLTCDQNHDYTPEQKAFDHGAADAFVQNTNTNSCSAPDQSIPNVVMDYYDGNTVTAMWNYAQRFAMSDNSFSTTYGPSTEGALNVIAGQTYGVLCSQSSGDYSSTTNGDPNAYPSTLPTCQGGKYTTGGKNYGTAAGTGTMISDSDQYYDTCSNASVTAAMGGPNIGTELTAAKVTWGWFEGGFQNQGYTPGDPSTSTVATKGCTSKHYNIGAGASLDGHVCTSGTGCVADYSAHHEPFQYYFATSNPTHAAPSSIAAIGTNSDGGANHQYDLADFWAAVDSGNMPAVSYLKAPKFQDGHPGYSDPLDEQSFLVDTLNHLQKSADWKSTAVVIAYDDSDGWYDHVLAPLVMQSQTPTAPPAGFEPLDQLTNSGQCGANAARVPQTDASTPEQARCGYGMRQPLLVISPWARDNYVDHRVTDQSSLVRFIEDNWKLGRLGNGSADAFAGTLDGLFDFTHHNDSKLLLDPSTGEPQH